MSTFDSYVPLGRNTLDFVKDASTYLAIVESRLKTLQTSTRGFDLCLYNAGMDVCEDCSIGGLAGITRAVLAERERLVFGWCRQQEIPVAFVLAGGYSGARLNHARLVELHRLTLSAARRN